MIVVFGSINLDLIFPLARLPAPGETVLGAAARLEPGGKGANQAVAAARDGARVVMVGAVGTDALAEPAMAGLIAAGVDVSRVARVPVPTGAAAICTDPTGRNQIAVAAGANAMARADQVEDALLGPGHVLLLQMECDPGETASLVRRAAGCVVVLNLAPAAALADDVLRRIDVLVVNESEAEFLGGDAAAVHARLGVAVVRTLGAAGAEYCGPAGALAVAAWPVVAVDSTAAGDGFIGVLAAGLDAGLAVADALRRASAAGALSCMVAGSQGSLPVRGAIDDFMSGVGV